MQTTRKIVDIYATPEAQTEAQRRRRDCEGRFGGDAWHRIPEGATLILDATNTSEVQVWAMPDGSEVSVGGTRGPWIEAYDDLDEDGPWAVTITPVTSDAEAQECAAAEGD